ncbi:MAG: dienelactone hydrolase [Pseudomonadota bacterium]
MTALLAGPTAAENRIDTQLPGAPELAKYGDLPVGVRTLTVTNKNQIDVAAIDGSKPKPDTLPMADRTLTLEVWYPAAAGATGSQVLKAKLRDGKTEVELVGQARRDAAPAKADSAYPLVIVSHGYPGNRFLLSHLAENIASKGYVVASIDHKDSTYSDRGPFGSTLVNRPLDQLFVLNEMDRFSKEDGHPMNGLVDASNTAIIGYSMGGYGAVITAGGGVTDTSIAYPWGAPHGLLAAHKGGSDGFKKLFDPRVKTAIAFAPWGMNFAFWDTETLKDVKIPMLYVSGSVDDVSGYEKGVRAIWQASTGVDRSLLTFDNANHNAAAPMPAPKEANIFDKDLGFNLADHYADAVWDTARMNNIAQHFTTAWLGKHLKGDAAMDAFLELVPNSNDGVYALEKDGTPKDTHTHWKGFPNRTAKGLRFETLKAGQ